MALKGCCMVAFMFFVSGISSAQTIKEANIYAHIFEPPQEVQPQYKVSKGITNPVKAVLDIMFVGYKHFVSSQDANHCSFYPSCSVYALQAVQKHGVIKGMLEGFDRLTRCNGLSPEQYDEASDPDLLYDPVK